MEVEIESCDFDLIFAEKKATYEEIKEYALKEHGLKESVQNCTGETEVWNELN